MPTLPPHGKRIALMISAPAGLRSLGMVADGEHLGARSRGEEFGGGFGFERRATDFNESLNDASGGGIPGHRQSS